MKSTGASSAGAGGAEPRAAARWLTLTEAAEFLGVKPRWLNDQVRARLVPHHRLGRQIRFTPSDLRLLEAQTAQTTVRDHVQSLTRRAG